MHRLIWRGFLVALALIMMTFGVAWAHGQPVITVNPALVAAGSSITVVGSEMEAGEAFTISLEGTRGSTKLGEATAKAEGEEAGFEVTLAIPQDTPPGSYTIRAATSGGESTSADLTVTLPSSQASAGPAMQLDPSGAAHVLPRSKPAGMVAGVVGTAILSAVLGLWLVTKRN